LLEDQEFKKPTFQLERWEANELKEKGVQTLRSEGGIKRLKEAPTFPSERSREGDRLHQASEKEGATKKGKSKKKETKGGNNENWDDGVKATRKKAAFMTLEITLPGKGKRSALDARGRGAVKKGRQRFRKESTRGS